MLTLTLGPTFTNDLTITGNNYPMKIAEILSKLSVECYLRVETGANYLNCLIIIFSLQVINYGKKILHARS